MRPVRRIEVVVAAPYARNVVELLAEQGLRGYTVIRGAAGAGERGLQLGDDLTGVSDNVYVLTTCELEDSETVTDALRPLLKKAGGVCLVSNAEWLEH